MADVYMHSKMTAEVIAKRNPLIEQKIAFMGAQSSDPMYYATLHKNRSLYRKYADRMHDTDTQKLLVHMVEYVKANNTLANYSFIFGFICHYALDVKIHPYVYHHVGVYKKNDPETDHFQGLHLKFERSIDCVLMEIDTKRKSRWMNLTRYHFPKKTPPDDVLALMKSVFQNQFQVDNGDEVYKNSVRYMYNVLKYMTTDRLGIKKQFYKMIDAFRHKHDLYLSLIHI
jgi:hypothetical protein